MIRSFDTELFSVRVDEGNVIIYLREHMDALSSTVGGGLKKKVEAIIFHQVEDCPLECDPRKYVERIVADYKLDKDRTIVYLTGASLPDRLFYTQWGDPLEAVFISVGLTPITCTHGNEDNKLHGTINIAYLTSTRLAESALVDAISIITSAKTAALISFHAGCGIGKGIGYATGTDAVSVLHSPYSDTMRTYYGPLTRHGRELFDKVYNLILNTSFKITTLEEWVKQLTGISLDEILNTALDFYKIAPVPDIEEEKIKLIIRKMLRKALSDPNTLALLISARHLDDIGLSGAIPGLTREDYVKDSKGILADELIGMALAIYLNGWKGLFSYYWIDRIKNQTTTTLSRMPVFMDDAIGSLIGGILSKAYDLLLHGDDS